MINLPHDEPYEGQTHRFPSDLRPWTTYEDQDRDPRVVRVRERRDLGKPSDVAQWFRWHPEGVLFYGCDYPECKPGWKDHNPLDLVVKYEKVRPMVVRGRYEEALWPYVMTVQYSLVIDGLLWKTWTEDRFSEMASLTGDWPIHDRAHDWTEVPDPERGILMYCFDDVIGFDPFAKYRVSIEDTDTHPGWSPRGDDYDS